MSELGGHDRPSRVSWQDYTRAEQFLPWNAAKQAFCLNVTPHWIGDTDRFWYCNETSSGKEFIVVDPDRVTRAPAFDHARLAASLSQAAGTYYEHNRLPFKEIEFFDGDDAIEFTVNNQVWTCNLNTYECHGNEGASPRSKGELLSPDGKWAAFLRDHNVYVRNTETGEEIQLTHDGEPYYDYGTRPEGSTTGVTDRLSGRPQPPMALWSKDSRRLALHRLDQREVSDMYLVQSVPPEGVRPVLHTYRYALVGDEYVPQSQLAVIDIEEPSVVFWQRPPQPSIGGVPIDHKLVWWDGDNARLYSIVDERGNQAVELCVTDAATGATRTILREEGPTYVDVSPYRFPPNVRTLNHGAEVVWWSERGGWGHLYLYDGETGKLKNQVTSGPWQVREVLHVDEKNRWIYFTAAGREPDMDPYYRLFYRARLDGSAIELLSYEDGDHGITAVPSGKQFIDTYSLVDRAPVTVLRSPMGEVILTLEKGDLSGLAERGWCKPERFRVKARDGITDIYGVVFFPSTFDADRRYPVVDSIYPGPQVIQAPRMFPDKQSREWRVYWDAQALAELGFIVVTIDGMGTPYRSKAFHDIAYGNDFGEAGGLEDHIAGLRQLAAGRPYMDLSRVGIFGHSGGGYASARALLKYPDFYKVAVSSAGNHDQRCYLAGWGERYVGLLDGDNYDEQANPPLAANLRGKLLLVYGEMDDNVHPCGVLRLVDALIKANRDFDMLVLPNRNHSQTHDPYFIRRKWDYFVCNLAGAEPPSGYRIADVPEEFIPEQSFRQKGI